MKIKTAEDKTDGGILLPTTAQTKPQGGEVVAVGEGKTIGKAKVDISVKVMSLLMVLCFAMVFYYINVLLTGCLSMHRLAPKLCIPSTQGLNWSTMVQSISY